jgi:hypothetical protein
MKTGRAWVFALLTWLLLPAAASAAPRLSQGPLPNTVTLAWDANPQADGVTGYRVWYGTASGEELTVVDAGNVLTWTSASLTPATYYFVVTAYTPDVESLPSPEVWTTVGQGDPCAPPLGATAVSIFITKLEDTTGNVGSQARLNFQLGSPGAPITSLTVSVNGVTQTPNAGTNLNNIGGIWFTTPATAGTFPVTLTALNSSGCSTTAAKDALGNPLTVTVK